jgi:hypothetical protein
MSRRTRLFLILALIVVGLLTARSALHGMRHARQFRAGSEEPIQAWMTVPFIAHAYAVPPEVVHEGLGLPLDRPDRRPIWRIARDQDHPPELLITELQVAIESWRASLPPVPPAPPVPPVTPVPPAMPGVAP